MKPRPSLDLHAHIDANIHPSELRSLGVVFAATRSLDEAAIATRRRDAQTIWGVGCHPGLAGAQKHFDIQRFSDLIRRTSFVSEVGLDGKSRVPLETQSRTLDAILEVLMECPRLTSLHSYEASDGVVRSLERYPIEGSILHWWLGDERQTRKALDLGCCFSFNSSSIRRTDLLDLIPLDRLLTETDHPFGDRRCGSAARPGFVGPVERAFAHRHRLSAASVRATMWENLARLIGQTQCEELLPPPVGRQLLAN